MPAKKKFKEPVNFPLTMEADHKIQIIEKVNQKTSKCINDFINKAIDEKLKREEK